MNPVTVDGIVIDRARALELRQRVIEVRDAATASGSLDYAFDLSLVVALLAHYADQVNTTS